MKTGVPRSGTDRKSLPPQPPVLCRQSTSSVPHNAGIMNDSVEIQGFALSNYLQRLSEVDATRSDNQCPVLEGATGGFVETQPSLRDPKQTDSEKVLALAREKTVTALEHYPVSARVNNAKNQSAELIEPFENPAQCL